MRRYILNVDIILPSQSFSFNIFLRELKNNPKRLNPRTTLNPAANMMQIIPQEEILNPAAKDTQNTPQQMSNNKDIISLLPIDPIKLFILSFLPLEDAIMTTFLSSAWRDVWIDIPNLNFNRAFFDKALKMEKVHRDTPDRQRSLKVFEFIDQTLMRKSKMQCNKITTFTLDLGGLLPKTTTAAKLSHYLDKWFNLVMNDCQAEKVIFNNVSRLYEFGFKPYLSTLPLRRLELDWITLYPEILELLSRHCPLIEILCFSICHANDKFRVSNFPKLEVFKLHCCCWENKGSNVLELELIDLPNLRVLRYMTIGSGEIQVDKTCDSLEYIELRDVKIRFNSIFSKRLTDLILDNCEFVEDVEIWSNHLEALYLNKCTYSDGCKVIINAPNLHYFSFSGSKLPPFFVLNHLDLEVAEFHWRNCQCELEDPPHEKFVEFLEKIGPCKQLELQTNSVKKEMIFEQEVREKWNSPLSEVKHLRLGLYEGSWSNTRLNIDDYIDTLLWLCPCPLTITILLLQPYSNPYFQQLNPTAIEFKVIKFKYYEGGHQGEKRCKKCEFLPVRCWKHSLEAISIENHKGYRIKEILYAVRRIMRKEDDNNIKAFFEKVREEEKIRINIIS